MVNPEMTQLTISHSIQLPPSFDSPSTATPPSNGTFEYPLDLESPSSHLKSLERQLGQARHDLNERLTQWKDLLRDVEKEDKHQNKANKKADPFGENPEEEEDDGGNEDEE